MTKQQQWFLRETEIAAEISVVTSAVLKARMASAVPVLITEDEQEEVVSDGYADSFRATMLKYKK